jgi:hypothetical protein
MLFREFADFDRQFLIVSIINVKTFRTSILRMKNSYKIRDLRERERELRIKVLRARTKYSVCLNIPRQTKEFGNPGNSTMKEHMT